MKAVILAGGKGTRLWPDTQTIPKPMVTIGGIPMIEHIVNRYRAAGVDDFIICTGHMHDALDLWVDRMFDKSPNEPDIIAAYTGDDALTGTRLKQILHLVKDEPYFHMTYGDGLADIDLRRLEQQHEAHRKAGCTVTMTVVKPPGRFGVVEASRHDIVTQFQEKPVSDQWVNGGFFMMSPDVLDEVVGNEAWEEGPMRRLVNQRRVAVNRHTGFWQCMDAPRDRQLLEELWQTGCPPWVATTEKS